MFLNKINLTNFKNIESAEVSFSSKINCIFGNNGDGKTSLLDAIYYLATTKSFITPSDSHIIKYDENQMIISGMINNGSEEENLYALSLNRKGVKVLKKNGKSYDRLSDHIGDIPIVVISPSDTSLIHDSAEERRKFLNFILSQIDKTYLRYVQSYHRLLQQRNKLLKMESFSPELAETITLQMAPFADYIYKKRAELVIGIRDLASGFYKQISSDNEEIELNYESDMESNDFMKLAEDSMTKDRIMGHTTSGIHRDDVSFLMNGHSVKRSASQGQQKSFLISLKLAQFSYLTRISGVKPLLLLDDVFDKLDYNRVEQLIGMVSGPDFGQIFITDSNKVRLATITDKVGQVDFFSVKEGLFTHQR